MNQFQEQSNERELTTNDTIEDYPIHISEEDAYDPSENETIFEEPVTDSHTEITPISLENVTETTTKKEFKDIEEIVPCIFQGSNPTQKYRM